MASNIARCITWKLDSTEYAINPNKSLTEIYNKNVTLHVDEYYFNHKKELFVCVPQSFQPPFYYVDLMYVCQWVVSVISLVFCVVIHYAKSGSKANRSLVCHQISLIAFYLSGIVYVLSQSDSLILFNFIRYFGVYTCRAAFCWLTVINFDKWRILRPENINRPSTSTTKFFLESLFAWSIPAVLIGITSSLKLVGVQYSSDRMTLHQNDIQVIVLYGSTAVIVVTNTVLFSMTVRNLRIYGKSITQANKKIFDQLAIVYVKLMIVTGINSILLVFEWAVIVNFPIKIWIIVDSIYGLQGFFIFLAYHGKLSTLKNFWKNCVGWLRLLKKIPQVDIIV